MRNFKNRIMMCLYLISLFNPPTRLSWNGKQYRKTGSSLYFPFWQGYDNPNICHHQKDSPAYAVWCAGVDYKKLGGKNYPSVN